MPADGDTKLGHQGLKDGYRMMPLMTGDRPAGRRRTPKESAQGTLLLGTLI